MRPGRRSCVRARASCWRRSGSCSKKPASRHLRLGLSSRQARAHPKGQEETHAMIPAGFDYHAPRSVADAVKLLGSLGPDARLLAGGHSLLPMMKLRFATPSALIDLGKIPDLRGIAQAGNEIRIGAMTTEHELLHSKLVAEKLPLLAEGAGQIADPQVRYR